MTSPINFSNVINELLVVQKIIDSCRRSDKAIPASILAKFSEIGRVLTLTSCPKGYSWASKYVSIMSPVLFPPSATESGAAGAATGVAAAVDTAAVAGAVETETVVETSNSLRHIQLLLSRGLLEEAREIFASFDEDTQRVVAGHICAFKKRPSILFTITAGSEGSFGEAADAIETEAQAIQEYTLPILLMEKMQETLFRTQEPGLLSEIFKELHADCKSLILKIAKELVISNSGVDIQRALFNEICPAHITAAVLGIALEVLKSNHGEHVSESEAAAGAGAGAGTAGMKKAAAKKKVEAKPATTEEYLPDSHYIFRILEGSINYEAWKVYGGCRNNLFLNLQLCSMIADELSSDKGEAIRLNHFQLFTYILDCMRGKRYKEGLQRLTALCNSMADVLVMDSLHLLPDAFDERLVREIFLDGSSDTADTRKEGTCNIKLHRKELEDLYEQGAEEADQWMHFLVSFFTLTYSGLVKKAGSVYTESVDEDKDKKASSPLTKVGSHIPKANILKLGHYSTYITRQTSDAISKYMRVTATLAKHLDPLIDCSTKFTEYSEATKDKAPSLKFLACARLVLNESEGLSVILPKVLESLREAKDSLQAYFSLKEKQVYLKTCLVDETFTSEEYGDCSVSSIEKAIAKYKARATQKQISNAYAKVEDLSIEFAYLRHYSRILSLLEQSHAQFEPMLGSEVGFSMPPAVARLLLLLQNNYIKLSDTGPTFSSVNRGRKPVVELKDRFKNTIRLVAPQGKVQARVSSDVKRAKKADARAEALAADDALIEESEFVEESTIEEVGRSETGLDLADTIPHLLLALQRENRLVTTSAKTAFKNAAQYALVVHHLLLSQTRTTSSAQLQLLEEDVRIAAYYAIEQLLTSILMEKFSLVSPKKASIFFEDAGHFLVVRCMHSGIKLPYKIQKCMENCEMHSLKRRMISPYSDAMASGMEDVRGIGEGKRTETNATAKALDALKVFFYLCHTQNLLSPSKGADELENVFNALSAIVPTPPPSLSEEGAATTAAGASAYEVTPFYAAVAPLTAKNPQLVKEVASLDHYLACIKDSGATTLAPFYIHQAQFAIIKILEESLCAAAPPHIASQRFTFRHRLYDIALHIPALDLSKEEVELLKNANVLRNQARYELFGMRALSPAATAAGDIAEAESDGEAGGGAGAGAGIVTKVMSAALRTLPSTAAAATAAPPAEDEAPFTAVTSSSQQKAQHKLEKMIALGLSILRKIASSPSMTSASGGAGAA